MPVSSRNSCALVEPMKLKTKSISKLSQLMDKSWIKLHNSSGEFGYRRLKMSRVKKALSNWKEAFNNRVILNVGLEAASKEFEEECGNVHIIDVCDTEKIMKRV